VEKVEARVLVLPASLAAADSHNGKLLKIKSRQN